MSSSKSNDRRSLYEAYEEIEEKKKEGDLIYRVMMELDTTEIDKILMELKESAKKEFPNLSVRFEKFTTRSITESQLDARTAKHGMFFLFLFLNKDFADSLIQSPPKVDPQRFKRFYEIHLPNLCNMLLNSSITSLADFVERTRSTYVII